MTDATVMGGLVVIRTKDNKDVNTIDASGHDVAIIPDGAYMYVAASNVLFVIRISDYTVVEEISVDTNPHDVVVAPNGGYINVAAIKKY